MPPFQYVAKDGNGKTIKGQLEAADEKGAVRLLQEKKLAIISVEAGVKEKVIAVTRVRAAKVPHGEIVMFSRQLATMINAGIPLLQSIEILADQTEHRGFKAILADIQKQVASGSSLSQAMTKYEKTFTELFINMVKAGEQSGSLDEIMDRLASYTERTQRLIGKMKSAMVYPTVVTLMAFGITFLLLVNVIPTFKDMYADLNAELPIPTQVLINISDLMINNLLFVCLGIGVIFFHFALFKKTARGRYMMDSFALKMPVFGILTKKFIISRFSRTLATLVRSGVPILASLEILKRTMENSVLEKVIDEVHTSAKEGAGLMEPLKKSGVFPPMVVRMVGVGEKSGELEKMLTKIAEFYEEQVETTISGLTSLIEPLVIAFLGVVIGGVVICMFLPIFSLSQAVGV
jgi:type IV pilus assembly protein PilC